MVGGDILIKKESRGYFVGRLILVPLIGFFAVSFASALLDLLPVRPGLSNYLTLGPTWALAHTHGLLSRHITQSTPSCRGSFVCLGPTISILFLPVALVRNHTSELAIFA